MSETCGMLLECDLASASGELACGRARGHAGLHAPTSGGRPSATTEMVMEEAARLVSEIEKTFSLIAVAQRHPKDPSDWIFAATALRAIKILRGAQKQIAEVVS